MKDIKRRDFLKYTGTGVAALVVGNGLPWIFKDEAYAAVRVQTLSFSITDAEKSMVTDNPGNPVPAKCYFWIYKAQLMDSTGTRVLVDLPPDCPGPNIFCTEGDLVKIIITNNLDENHNFFIKGAVNSGEIAPGATKTIRFKAPRAGTYLYYDSLNAPVNRVMGLHGAFIVMPKAPRPGHKFTPYSRPTANVQKMYDHFGSTTHYPGLAWEQGDPATGTPPFRQYLWLVHDASPKLFAEVGNLPAGANMDPVEFVNKFTQDPINPAAPTADQNYRPQYFTLQGQSGHFSHNHPFICPNNRVGEPVLVRMMHAGLQTHSLHIHANHVWVTSINGVVQANPLWVDTMTAHPLDTWEYTVPYMRPPDIPNIAGIGPVRVNIPGLGFADTPQTCQANPNIPGSTPHPTWPPNEELGFFFPAVGAVAGATSIAVQLSPMCYPMHDHSEPTQTSQGGNYNMGLISGINFTGDRNQLGSAGGTGVVTFPNNPTLHGPSETGTPAGPEE